MLPLTTLPAAALPPLPRVSVPVPALTTARLAEAPLSSETRPDRVTAPSTLMVLVPLPRTVIAVAKVPSPVTFRVGELLFSVMPEVARVRVAASSNTPPFRLVTPV